MKASIIVFFAIMILGCLINLPEDPGMYTGFIGWSILNIIFTSKLERKKNEERIIK